MILASAAAGAKAPSSTDATATRRPVVRIPERIKAIQHERAAFDAVRRAAREAAAASGRPRRAARRLDLDDVDGLGALVAGLLLVGDLRAFGEGAVSVPRYACVVDEQV